MGPRQTCGLCPVLFYIHMNKITQLWQQTTPKGITFSNGRELRHTACVDDLVLTAVSKDAVQRSVTTLNKIL